MELKITNPPELLPKNDINSINYYFSGEVGLFNYGKDIIILNDCRCLSVGGYLFSSPPAEGG
jgi:hypothetical protein